MHAKLTLLFLFFFTTIFGQSGKKEKPINQYKNEVALDFQNAFRNLLNGFNNNEQFNSEALALSMIYKRRIGEKTFISVKEKKALRIQLGGSFDVPISTEELFDSTLTGNANLLRIKESRTDVYSYIGLEWQKQFDKLQFFYGFDTGLRFDKDIDVPVIFSSSSGQVSFWRENQFRRISIPLIGFAGIKYYLHPRFSLSYELSFGTAIGFIRRKQNRYEPDVEGVAEREYDYKRTELTGSSDYLRYFMVSYYF